MKIKSAKTCGAILGIVAAIVIFLAVGAISWLATCGIIKLITLCFGWKFSWAWATGIWLIMFLLSSTFKTTVKK